eukprot:CAMPEP_0204864298 /NCGR_PEP_ID=MMETSP1348-20121228/3966_1 /ASSEMBLY_ACC=CAM_ASM_000700 /TAXON_ID=215587 /ORGANISM="Aplanochytrium stocchinoi, Strain GSBS06" /LENGTH=51 /DNA_ID=CAMNT_0052014891 /DNA_START=128 /DNA_END=283 /DNA_ORIENTATION=-
MEISEFGFVKPLESTASRMEDVCAVDLKLREPMLAQQVVEPPRVIAKSLLT